MKTLPLPPRERPTARIFVLDERNRLLLLRAEVVSRKDPTVIEATFWHTPGGGVEPGETFAQAAQRELWEETGLDAEIGPQVWAWDDLGGFPDGSVLFRMQFFLARVSVSEVTFANIVPYEQRFLQEFRWWTWDELQAHDDSTVRLSPPADVLRGVLAPFMAKESDG